MAEAVSSPSVIKLGWFMLKHLDDVLEAERNSHEFEDPDFNVPQCEVFALSETEDWIELLKQYRSKSKGTEDTRARVATIDGKVVGAYVYEIQVDGYEIVQMTISPASPNGGIPIRKAMLDELIAKAKSSTTRKRLSCYVPDGDYRLLKFLMDSGWSHKLVYNPTGNDSWYCEYKIPPNARPTKPSVTPAGTT